MKKYIAILVVLIALSLSAGDYASQKQKNLDMLSRQRMSDKENKEALLRKMKLFMNEINGRLGDDRSTRIDVPVDTNKMTDLKKTEDMHSSKKVPERAFGYINDSQVRFRSEPNTGAAVIGRFNFAERVELLMQSKERDAIDSVTAPWLLVRRVNEEEGWVFSAFVQKGVPDRKEGGEIHGRERVEDKKGASGEGFAVPAIGTKTSKFGYRVHPVSKKAQSFHQGIDIACPKGTDVMSAADGIVRIAGWNANGYGNLIVIEHEKDLSTYYGHLEKILVKAGERVKKGTRVGTVDSTGMSTGNHLHFEVRKSGQAMDPDSILR